MAQSELGRGYYEREEKEIEIYNQTTEILYGSQLKEAARFSAITHEYDWLKTNSLTDPSLEYAVFCLPLDALAVLSWKRLSSENEYYEEIAKSQYKSLSPEQKHALDTYEKLVQELHTRPTEVVVYQAA